MGKKTSRAIGIDLGTTYTCAAVFQNGIPTVIPTKEGDRTLESLVGFEKESLVFGSAAKSLLNGDPAKGAANPKRFIGRGFDEPEVAQAMKLLKHNVKRKGGVDADKKDNILYVIDRGLNEGEFTQTPIQLSAFILKHVKEYSEKFLGHDIVRGVITVPAHFNDSQRSTTMLAAQMAGFKDVKLLNEPTAAAMAYAYKEQQASDSGEQTVFVFDLGGGTFDVSFLELGDKLDEGSSLAHVVATDGDVFLGGLDFDKALVDMCLDAWKRKHASNPRMLEIGEKQTRRLLTACEKAKRALSNQEMTTIELDCFVSDVTFQHRVTRAAFEAATKHLRARTISIVKRCLLTVSLKDKAPLQPREISYDKDGLIITTRDEDALIAKAAARIHKVLMVGGSSRIPSIHSDLKAFFKRDILCHEIHPDEAVAMGASYYAAMLAGDSDMAPEQMICLLETTPFAIGIETLHGQMAVIVPQGTTIPARKIETFTTHDDKQPSVSIKVHEGNSPLVQNNVLLGSFQLNGIPPAPRGVPQIEVCIEITTDGIIKITASEKSTGKTNHLTVENTQKDPKEVERLRKQYEETKEADERAQVRVKALMKLEDDAYAASKSLADAKIDDTLKAELTTQVNDFHTWIQNNQEADLQTLQAKQAELQTLMQRMSTSYNQGQAPTGEPTIEEVE